MKTIYLDSDFRCHLNGDDTMRAVETSVFDGIPDAYINGYRYIPDGETWVRPDGEEFHGIMIAPAEDYDRIIINVAISYLDDEQAESVAQLFSDWQVDVFYAVGDRRVYDGILYRCEQAHTSQAGWEPPNVPALWTKIAKPGEIPVWKQPSGAQDAYSKGDKVHYPAKDDPVYVSEVDNNVWEPTVYGWSLEG